MPSDVMRVVPFRVVKRWESRPQHQGLAIPYVAVVDEHGVPNFQAVDQASILDCALNSKCGICGQSLTTGEEEMWLAFIGGSACIETLEFIDPAMHPECAYYAAETCPFLANADGGFSKKVSERGIVEEEILVPSDRSRRPPKLIILFAKGYRAIIKDRVMLFCPPRDPHVVDWQAMPRTKR